MKTKNNRHGRKQVAELTLEFLEKGRYFSPNGTGVYFTSEQQAAEKGTICYSPEDSTRILQEVTETDRKQHETQIFIRNETTLSAARRLVQEVGITRTAALNFASAKNPGGGFLGGSQAQEESLARSSGLYPTLKAQEAYYLTNRNFGSALYSDYIIFSPQVPVFRNDENEILDPFYLCSFITCPAPNAGAVQQNRKADIPLIGPTMRRRISKVLAIAEAQQMDALVLGAFGCGVFRNDPAEVAGYFAELLLDGGPFEGAFKRIDFAVLDHSGGKTYTAFEAHFG